MHPTFRPAWLRLVAVYSSDYERKLEKAEEEKGENFYPRVSRVIDAIRKIQAESRVGGAMGRMVKEDAQYVGVR